MKHFLVVLILIVQLPVMAFALFEGEENENVTFNVGVGFFWETAPDTGEKVAEALLLSSLTAGAGYHINLIPNIIAPGLYADFHISFLSFLGDRKDNDEEIFLNDSTLFFQVGLRLYNQFRFGPIDIQPFAGVNLFAAPNDSIGLYLFGALVAINNIGIEYSYQQPLRPQKRNKLVEDMHRVCLVLHMR